MRLYRFTSLPHLVSILADEAVTKGEIPVTPTRTLNGVWATESAQPGAQKWAQGSLVDKTQVRIVISSEKGFERWVEMAPSLGVSEGWFDALDRAAAGQSAQWWVRTNTLPLEKVSIQLLQAGKYAPLPPVQLAERAIQALESFEGRLPLAVSQSPAVSAWLSTAKIQAQRLFQRHPSLFRT